MDIGNYTWEDCLNIYRYKDIEEWRGKNPTAYEAYLASPDNNLERYILMFKLIEQLRDDPEIPELKRMVSHLCLRLWLPDTKGAEVHIEPIDKNKLWIGLNQFEDVEVPLEFAARTVKHFLKKLKSRQNTFALEKDETGDIENELKALPLDWVQSAALQEIYFISLRHAQYTVNLEQNPDVPDEILNKIAVNMSEITKLVMKTWEIAREKRTQSWLEELEKDND